MKSIPQGAGNCKMRGKLTKQMSCGCCQAVNFKWNVRVKEALKEIRQHSSGSRAVD